MSYTTHPLSTFQFCLSHMTYSPVCNFITYLYSDLPHFSEHSSLCTYQHWTCVDESWYLWVRLFCWTLILPKHVLRKFGKLTFFVAILLHSYRYWICSDKNGIYVLGWTIILLQHCAMQSMSWLLRNTDHCSLWSVLCLRPMITSKLKMEAAYSQKRYYHLKTFLLNKNSNVKCNSWWLSISGGLLC